MISGFSYYSHGSTRKYYLKVSYLPCISVCFRGKEYFIGFEAVPAFTDDVLVRLCRLNPKFWAIVPAAGAGKRMGADIPKQYLTLGDRTVLEHTLDTLLSCQRLAGVILVLCARQMSAGRSYAHALCEAGAGNGWTVVQSVAIQYSMDSATSSPLAPLMMTGCWCMMPPGPVCARTILNVLMSTLEDGTGQGGLLGVPVADTMKRVDEDVCISATVDRVGLWHAYTPQMFRAGALRTALQQAIGVDTR